VMELKDFIKTTLRELSEAISESASELDKNVRLTNTTLQLKDRGNYGLIDFDLSVGANDKNTVDGNAKAGISVLAAKIGTTGESSSSTTSRIKFTVEADFS
jgi:hypothetical protein